MRFSMKELMIVTVVVSITAASVSRHVANQPLVTAFLALCIGLTASGPILLTLRRKAGELAGDYGIGEIAWFCLGAYYLFLVLSNLLAGFEKSQATYMVMAACGASTASVLAFVVIAVARTITTWMGADLPSNRWWFVPRGTNYVGIALVVVLALLGVVLALQNF